MMKKYYNAYRELKEKQMKEVNELPIKAAFSQEQFEKMMLEWGFHPENDQDKILPIIGGCFIRKADEKLVFQTLKRHREEIEKAIAADKTGKGFIFDMFYEELTNHEYGYTYDEAPALYALCLTCDDVMNDERLKTGFIKAVTAIEKEEI